MHYYSRSGRILNPKSVGPGVGCVAIDSAPGDVDQVGLKALEIIADRSLDWVFVDTPGDEDEIFDVVISRVLKKLKLKGHLHTFRHSFISHALTQGVAEALVRRWVGHVDAEILKRYTHVADGISKAAMARLAAASAKSVIPDTEVLP